MGAGTEPLAASAWAAGGVTPLNAATIVTSADNNLNTTFNFYSFIFIQPALVSTWHSMQSVLESTSTQFWITCR
jgi:hypothetical protein